MNRRGFLKALGIAPLCKLPDDKREDGIEYREGITYIIGQSESGEWKKIELATNQKYED